MPQRPAEVPQTVALVYGMINVENEVNYQPKMLLLDENNNVVKVEQALPA